MNYNFNIGQPNKNQAQGQQQNYYQQPQQYQYQQVQQQQGNPNQQQQWQSPHIKYNFIQSKNGQQQATYQPVFQQQQYVQQQNNQMQNQQYIKNQYQNQNQYQQTNPAVQIQYGNIKIFQNFTIFLSNSLGKGQYGEVFLCIDNRTQRQYACKMIAIHQQSNVLQELQVAQQIQGEFICELKYAGISQNYLYLISEYCPDGTLKQWYQNKQKFSQVPLNEIMRIFLQIVKGYNDSIKSKGFIHRDLKLDNILMMDDKPKICDFGFGKFLDDVNVSIEMSYKCTPLYGAPQITNTPDMKYSYKADIYSLGVLLLYQLTNNLLNPNLMKTQAELVKFHESNKQEGIRKTLQFQNYVPQIIKNIIYEMMEYTEEARISIEDLLKRVQEICNFLRNPTGTGFTGFSDQINHDTFANTINNNNQMKYNFNGKTTS